MYSIGALLILLSLLFYEQAWQSSKTKHIKLACLTLTITYMHIFTHSQNVGGPVTEAVASGFDMRYRLCFCPFMLCFSLSISQGNDWEKHSALAYIIYILLYGGLLFCLQESRTLVLSARRCGNGVLCLRVCLHHLCRVGWVSSVCGGTPLDGEEYFFMHLLSIKLCSGSGCYSGTGSSTTAVVAVQLTNLSVLGVKLFLFKMFNIQSSKDGYRYHFHKRLFIIPGSSESHLPPSAILLITLLTNVYFFFHRPPRTFPTHPQVSLFKLTS